MENKNNLNKQTIGLIGRMGVGKSFISTYLKDFLNYDLLINLDEIFSFVMLKKLGGFYLNEYKLNILKNSMEDKYLKPLLQNNTITLAEYEELKLKQQEEIERQALEKAKMNQLFSIQSFIDIAEVWEIAKENDAYLKEHSKEYTQTEYLFIQQIIKLELLDRCLQKLKEPAIIDIGGIIGPVLDIPKERVDKINQLFNDELSPLYGFIHSKTHVKNFQEYVLGKIDTVIQLKGGSDYITSKLPNVHCEDNKLFIKNKDSYQKFAHATITVDKLFVVNDDPCFENRNSFNVYAFKKRDELKNQEMINKVCKDIKSVIVNNMNKENN